MHYRRVREVSEPVADALEGEVDTQRETLLLIASENHVSRAVMEAQGSVLTNRNALGTPDSRLYPGSENLDALEALAIEHATELWGADHANVQPHSGSLANVAAYAALLEPGDRILSLHPADGGHVTHGHPAHLSGELYEVDHYRVDPETGRLDYHGLDERARAFEPDLIVSGFSAYPREIEWERIQAAADAVGAFHLADIAHLAGPIAAGRFPSPVGIADVATGSTYKTIRAGRGGFVLCDDAHAAAIDEAVFPGTQGGAAMPTIAGKAVGFAEALEPAFEAHVERMLANAEALADALAAQGLHVVSGGTDTHIAVVDLRHSHEDLTGARAEALLEAAGLITTKTTVPGETRPSAQASGLRLGTPALTSRGFDESAMESVGRIVARVLDERAVTDDVTEAVARLCAAHPLYE